MQGLRAVGRVLSNRRILAAEAGFSTYAIVLHGSWVAIILYAYGQGGVGEAGIASLVVLVPASICGPFVAVWFNRPSPAIALAGGLALQAAFMGVVTAVVSVDGPTWLVYAALALFATAQMTSRPTMATILPRIVDEPEELAASNSTTELIDTLGLMVGPALLGVVLLIADSPAAPFLASSILLAVGACVALAVGRGAVDRFADDGHQVVSFVADAMAGIKLVRKEKSILQLILLLSTAKLAVGALEVAAVPLALDQLDRSNVTAGFLTSAFGIGGLLGAILSLSLIGRRRLTGPIVLGLLAASIPLIIAGAATSVTQMLLLFVVAGLGRPILTVGGRTLLQGLSADDTLAQLFGFLEGLSMLAVAAGSSLFSLLAVTTSLKTALVISGLIPILLMLTLYRPVVGIDRHRPEVPADLLALVRKIPIFSTLPAFRIEQLLVNMKAASFEPNTVVFNEGDHGDLFHVVAEGEAIVELADREVRYGPGGFFGEIALLRDQPRMATVRVGGEGLSVHTLERDVFLAAVSSVPSSGRRADRVIEQRLTEDWPDHSG